MFQSAPGLYDREIIAGSIVVKIGKEFQSAPGLYDREIYVTFETSEESH